MVPVFWIQVPVCLYLYYAAPGYVEKWGTLINANVMVAFLIPWLPVLVDRLRSCWNQKSNEKWFWLSGILALLILVAVIQTVQLTGIKSDIKEIGTGAKTLKSATSSTKVSESSGSSGETPTNLQNLPGMVGGC